MIDGLKARIRECRESITAMEQRITELAVEGKSKALAGRFKPSKAMAKAGRPKKRKMSPAARKRISQGIRDYHANKKREQTNGGEAAPTALTVEADSTQSSGVSNVSMTTADTGE